MRWIIMLVVLAGCAQRAPRATDPDAAPSHDAAHDGGGGGSGSDAAGSAYVCTPDSNVVGSCCVFGSACGAGSSCYYNNASGPSQGDGNCATAAETPLAIGATCNALALPYEMNHVCPVDAWCAPDSNAGPQNNYAGICRQLCDPQDLAVHGCPSSTPTCVEMPQCTSAGQWPNCPPATNTHLGYCVP